MSERPLLRVVSPEPRELDRAAAWVEGWRGAADQADWCVAVEGALASGCTRGELEASAMTAAERRAIHLARQAERARAVLAQPDPAAGQELRERTRRLAILSLSAVAHLVAFAVLAWAVADLEPRPRPADHEHLFEARAVVPVEIEEPTPAPTKPEVVREPSEPAKERPEPPRRPSSPTPAEAEHDHRHTEQSEPAPYELEGFELSSEGELAAGAGGGEAWGRPGGRGVGSGAGGGPAEPEPSETPRSVKPDELASPRGGFVKPEYPLELERRGVEGTVLVKVWIDEHGHVIDVEVVRSSGHEALDHNALMAARRQDWVAATRGGRAVPSTRRYRINFTLD